MKCLPAKPLSLTLASILQMVVFFEKTLACSLLFPPNIFLAGVWDRQNNCCICPRYVVNIYDDTVMDLV